MSLESRLLKMTLGDWIRAFFLSAFLGLLIILLAKIGAPGADPLEMAVRQFFIDVGRHLPGLVLAGMLIAIVLRDDEERKRAQAGAGDGQV